MKRQISREAPHNRRLSISELPKLTRASTVEIEMMHLKLYARYYAKKLGRVSRTVGNALKWTATIIFLLPMLPTTLFFILADKVTQAFRDERVYFDDEDYEIFEGVCKDVNVILSYRQVMDCN
ncbi:hypothetical protein HD806DRAFT_541974 [Xylariaceae sp. AK1471]|nr:hypothetical protein HD806DRAFT_541974 [Xylariaceae sp. AK1471]